MQHDHRTILRRAHLNRPLSTGNVDETLANVTSNPHLWGGLILLVSVGEKANVLGYVRSRLYAKDDDLPPLVRW